MRPDAILSYHLDPMTCGVAKFNHALAERLGVPMFRATFDASRIVQRPLLSVKLGEYRECPMIPATPFDLLLHDPPVKDVEWDLVFRARRVYAANPDIATHLRPRCASVETIFCPSTLHGNADRPERTILTFGMAHKVTSAYYERLRDVLDAAGEPYAILLSTGVHEGSPWSEALTGSADRLRTVFGDRLRVLGYLADDALAHELAHCTAAAAFFEPALRANNTSAWAVLEAGKPLITNLDANSPQGISHAVMDIAQMARWPHESVLSAAGVYGKRYVSHFSWDALVNVITA